MAGLLQGPTKKHRKSKRIRPTLMSEINVTPFVDVMLVLLIIFMVTAPLMATGIKINLPNSNVSQLENEKEEPLNVLIDKKGNLYIQKEKVTYNDLAEKLREVTKQNLNTHIYVRGDKKAFYGDIIKAISAINESGFTKVGLVTQPRQGKK